jgi:uncharacterized NAD(P)/FAD-binding protein YdhS
LENTGQNEKFTIAVVGGGAACVAFLHHLIEHISLAAAKRVQVRIFEPRSMIGPGLAYQPDLDSLLLNRAVETMSVSAGDFSTFTSWVRWKVHHKDELKVILQRDLSSSYVARELFGRYLHEFFRETREHAVSKGLAIDIVQREVHSIQRGTRYVMHTDDATYEADSVLLAIGNTGQHDHYGLAGHPRYFHQPYPLAPHLATLTRARKICILGASLTAVDVAVSLFKVSDDVEIHMLSPNATLPYVKGKHIRPKPLRFLTRDAIHTLTSGGKTKIGLRTLGRLLRAEFKAIGSDWRELFAQANDARQLLHDEILHADSERPWQSILVATNDVIEYAWEALDRQSQALVFRRFARQWMARRAPMPVQNARLLARMLDQGRLKMVRAPAEFDRSSGDRIAMRQNGETDTYDYVVNATGAAKSITGPQDSRLGWQLLQSGLACQDWRGGFRVDFNTGALVGADGEPDWQLRLLGHLTSGTYFFVSSLEMVARRAQRIAVDVASALSEEDMALHPVGTPEEDQV